MNWSDFRFRLPLPPSANDLWTIGKRGGKATIVSTESLRDFNKRAEWALTGFARGNRLVPMIGPVEVWGVYYVPTLASDGPNRDKAFFDVLQGFVYLNDRQVMRWTMVKDFAFPGEPGHVEFRALELAHPEGARRLAESAARPKKARTAKKPKGASDRYVIEPAVYR